MWHSFSGSRLEDTLRLLALWFDKGDVNEVHAVLKDCLKQLPVETWLEVIPQLIARLDSKDKMVGLVKTVMLDIAKTHPQVFCFCHASLFRRFSTPSHKRQSREMKLGQTMRGTCSHP